jgi:hypothetical protein
MNEDINSSFLGFTDEDLPETAHICLIYNSEEERREIVSKFLYAGLRRKEMVRYFADSAEPGEVTGWLKDKGVEIPEDKDQIRFSVVKAVDFYAPEGKFSAKSAISRMIPRLNQTRDAGYPASRVTGEMSWVLRGLPGSEELEEYETMLTAVKHPFPHFGMCQYDARKFDGATLYKVLRVHPYIVANGQIVRNPYFVKPDDIEAESITGKNS